uniref:Uncharacterized protein n=1 Tax=Arundo donax TaxID=35708 RepID=A0A0A8Y4S3_ARUDO
MLAMLNSPFNQYCVLLSPCVLMRASRTAESLLLRNTESEEKKHVAY